MTDFDAKSARTRQPLPFWVGAFDRATEEWEPDTIGVYVLILLAMWKTKSCDLSSDEKVMARVARVSPTIWRRKYRPVIGPLLLEENGRFFSEKLQENAQKTEEFCLKQYQRKFGKSEDKSLKYNNQASSTEETTEYTTAEPEPITINNIDDDVDNARDAVSPHVGEAAMPQARSIGQADDDGGLTLREQILTALGADPKSGIAGAGMFLGTQSDMHTVQRWRGELGLTDAEILGQISDVMSKAKLKNVGFVPSRFTYFDRPMADFAGAKAAPQMQPTPYDGGRHGQYHNDQSIRQPANRHGAGLTAGFAAVASRFSDRS